VLPLQVGAVSFDREGVANHATQLASNIQGNLKRSLEALGVVSDGHTTGGEGGGSRVLLRQLGSTQHIGGIVSSTHCCL
jgi:hypothetical protein